MFGGDIKINKQGEMQRYMICELQRYWLDNHPTPPPTIPPPTTKKKLTVHFQAT